MKKLTVFAAIAGFLGLLVLAGQAVGGPTAVYLNWGTELNPGECPDGQLVININHKVTNDADSGEAGNWWAYDDYNRHIQVWQVGENTFCALAQYHGSFVTVATRSPGNTEDIEAGIQGTSQGGYRAIITGTLNPTLNTNGNIGTFDYGWNGNPNNGALDPFNWVDAYFNSGWVFEYEWWGWIYRTGSNGTWVNASTGNLGDITD